MKSLVIAMLAAATSMGALAQDVPTDKHPVCARDQAPYRDLDFLVGRWEFFMMDGTKIANQTYSKKSQGCLIQEDWAELGGETGTGMSFVDPATGLWRQVWMSASYHIDYSGKLDEKGALVLNGRVHPNDGRPAADFRGVYTRQPDGSVVKEFLVKHPATGAWIPMFKGVARRVAGS